MNFKTVFLARKDLDPRTVVNAVGHASMAFGWTQPSELIVTPRLVDRNGIVRAGVSAWPFVVLMTRSSKLERLVPQVRNDDRLRIVEFIEPMLTTKSDHELLNAVKIRDPEGIPCLGVLAHGPAAVVDEWFGSFATWTPIVGSAQPVKLLAHNPFYALVVESS